VQTSHRDFGQNFITLQRQIRGNLCDFKRDIMELLKEFGGDLQAMNIGHTCWNQNVNLSLSLNFFKEIIEEAPKIREIELFSVEDVASFISFWAEKGKQPENIKLKEKK
jgi:hypothetical protein